MKIILSDRAEKDLKKISSLDQIAIIQKIRSIQSLLTYQEKKLSGYKDIFRIRVGKYRIVYRKMADGIYVVLIKHRKDVYRMLKDLVG